MNGKSSDSSSPLAGPCLSSQLYPWQSTRSRDRSTDQPGTLGLPHQPTHCYSHRDTSTSQVHRKHWIVLLACAGLMVPEGQAPREALSVPSSAGHRMPINLRGWKKVLAFKGLPCLAPGPVQIKCKENEIQQSKLLSSKEEFAALSLKASFP